MRKTIFAACLLLACGTAWAQLDSWDTDNDGDIAEDEFYSGMSDAGIYGNVDQDDDGFVDENEFDQAGIDGSWDDWDTDNDGYLDSDEFYEGTFDAFDEDDDDTWNNDEFETASEEDWFEI